MAMESIDKKLSSMTKLRQRRIGARVAEQMERLDADETPKKLGERRSAHAERVCEQTVEAAQEEDYVTAWARCHLLDRILIETEDANQLQFRADSLRREAAEKLKNWRRDAVLDILDPKKRTTVLVSQVVAAQFLLDQYFENVYFKLELLGRRAKSLAWMLLVVLSITLIAASLLTWVWTDVMPMDYVLSDLSTTVLVLLAGAIGAALTHSLSAMSGKSRIPQVIESAQGWVLRLPLGALSALALVMLLQGPLAGFLVLEPNYIYGYALAAGFSDRLLDQAIRRIEKSFQE